MKKLLLLIVVLTTSCNYNTKTKTYNLQLTLVDGSYIETTIIADDKRPNFRIDCYNYDCGCSTGLHYDTGWTTSRFNRPGIVDYKIIE